MFEAGLCFLSSYTLTYHYWCNMFSFPQKHSRNRYRWLPVLKHHTMKIWGVHL